ncbi:MAG TPA: cbb3-type cytochrome c oxidase subunit 3 [Sphingobium sp.]|nr:cbb3-type cytochrome c oxidase subunit 3 [Sphingobium sp.]
MSYNDLRHFADSYGLAALLIVYLTLVGWAFRPGARARNEQAATMIFADEDELAAGEEETRHG